MRKVLILLIALGLYSCKPLLEVNLMGIEEKNLIEGSYIIDLKEDKFMPILVEYQGSDFLKDTSELIKIESNKIQDIKELGEKYGLELKTEDILVYTSSVFYIENASPEVIKKMLKDTKNVSGVQQDFTIHDIRAKMQGSDPIPQDIRAKMQESGFGTEDIRAKMQELGYDLSNFSSLGVTYVGGGKNPVNPDSRIWIVDSGIDGSHHDFTGQFTSDKDKSWVDSSPDEENPLIDYLGHGTHCAGLAAANAFNQTQPGNEGLIGMNGVSPGAQLVSLKVFANDRTAKWNWLRFALEYAGKYASESDVVSLSLGEMANCNSNGIKGQLESLSIKKVFVVMAAGNGENGIGVSASGFLPGCVDGLNGVFTIGSMRQDYVFPTMPNYFSIFSNFGTVLDWVAPGEVIFSTFPGNSYAVSSGTSAATAIVAGIIHANGGEPEPFATVIGPPGTSTYRIGKRITP